MPDNGGVGEATGDGGFKLLVAFDTDTAEFSRGFEAGRVWALLRSTREPVEAIVHAWNAEMMLRMAEATDRPVNSADLNDDWISVHFGEPRG